MKKLNATMTLEQQQSLQKRLVELVREQKSGHQIANELGVNYTTVHRWLRKLGLNLPNFHNELKFDNTVFDIIDTEEKAYWLGFMYADGYVSKNGVTVELSLKGDDIGHLQKFASFLHHKEGVYLGNAKCGDKEFTRCRLTLTNAHFNESLVKLGCVPNKSLILQFPNSSIFSSDNLVTHFIRGYVDGDGCIYATSKNKPAFNIVGTEEFLEGIMTYFPNCFSGSYCKDKRHPDSNTYAITNTCNKATEFGRALYDNASVYLQRKYEKFNELRNDKE